MLNTPIIFPSITDILVQFSAHITSLLIIYQNKNKILTHFNNCLQWSETNTSQVLQLFINNRYATCKIHRHIIDTREFSNNFHLSLNSTGDLFHCATSRSALMTTFYWSQEKPAFVIGKKLNKKCSSYLFDCLPGHACLSIKAVILRRHYG